MTQAVALRVLYLQRLSSVNGRDALRGRRLFDTFKAQSAECLLAHLVVDELPEPVARRVGKDIITHDAVARLEPNVVFLEGGLYAGFDSWRFERPRAEAFVREGGVFIVADVDANHWNDSEEGPNNLRACDFFKTGVSFLNPLEVVQVYDAVSCARGFDTEVICEPAKMTLESWPSGIYDDIARIVVGLPVHLSTVASYALASGNRDTARVSSRFGREGGDTAFATVTQIGAGYAVLIAGGVTDDVWAESCPDNPQWLVNVASVLAKSAAEEKARLLHRLTSGHRAFLSHRSTDIEIASQVSWALHRAGIDTWLDNNEIVSGDSFVTAIGQGLDAMTAFVLFWSRACLDSTWIDHEVNVAVKRLTEHHVPIMIVGLDGTPVPASLADLHRLDAAEMTPDEVAQTIAAAIARRQRRQAGARH